MLKQDCMYMGVPCTLQTCLEISMIKTFKLFPFSLESFIEEVFTYKTLKDTLQSKEFLHIYIYIYIYLTTHLDQNYLPPLQRVFSHPFQDTDSSQPKGNHSPDFYYPS